MLITSIVGVLGIIWPPTRTWFFRRDWSVLGLSVITLCSPAYQGEYWYSELGHWWDLWLLLFLIICIPMFLISGHIYLDIIGVVFVVSGIYSYLRTRYC